jgi:hypothetical protein
MLLSGLLAKRLLEAVAVKLLVVLSAMTLMIQQENSRP